MEWCERITEWLITFAIPFFTGFAVYVMYQNYKEYKNNGKTKSK